MKLLFLFFTMGMIFFGYQRGNYFFIIAGITLFAITVSDLNGEKEENE